MDMQTTSTYEPTTPSREAEGARGNEAAKSTPDQTAPAADLQDELLVEDVSIDGMCGVY